MDAFLSGTLAGTVSGLVGKIRFSGKD